MSETVTVVLPDGRTVDLSGTGDVQVHTVDRAHGYVLTLHDRFGRVQ